MQLKRHLLVLVLVLVLELELALALVSCTMPHVAGTVRPPRLMQAMDLTVTVTTTLVEISDMASQTTFTLGALMARPSIPFGLASPLVTNISVPVSPLRPDWPVAPSLPLVPSGSIRQSVPLY